MMSDILKPILAGVTAIPFILIFTIGIGLASGINPHFILLSVILTNIVGIFFNQNSSTFFNIGPGLVIIFFIYNESIGIESGYLQTFIIFFIPAIIFIILSFLPINLSLIPNRVIAILTFGIGVVIILKQLPNAFAYNTIQSNLSFGEKEGSFLVGSTISNWLQLSLAFSIPAIALIGRRFKRANSTLLVTVFVTVLIGYMLGYNTSQIESNSLSFSEPFKLDWTLSTEALFASISTGITVTVVMLISFWGDYSILEHNQIENENSIKRTLRTVGLGNLFSGIFGVMPSNVSLVDSFTIREFGGNNWISKIPIILVLIIIAIIGIPDFSFPVFAFAGVLIYIGIALLLKSWEILKGLKITDYVFTFLIGLAIIFIDYTTGFILAMIYSFLHQLFTKRKNKNNMPENFDEES